MIKPKHKLDIAAMLAGCGIYTLIALLVVYISKLLIQLGLSYYGFI